MRSGIYTITSPSGKQYVGCASDFAVRWGGHRSKLRRGIHVNPALQAAWNKYGEAAMVFEKIILCLPADLLRYEQMAMDSLKPQYNIAKVAGRNTGLRHSDDAKARIAEFQRGQTRSAETRKKMGAAKKGLVRTDQHRANLSAACKGKPKRGKRAVQLSPEHRAAISASVKAAHGARKEGGRR